MVKTNRGVLVFIDVKDVKSCIRTKKNSERFECVDFKGHDLKIFI